MATIYVGSARHDENGKYVNGEAGDQLQTSSTNDLAGEVSMQKMYTHTKGWYIIRAKKVSHANAIASAMKTACNNENIGYDQNGRLGIVTYGTATTTKTECDCSSLVRVCVKEATGTDPGNFTTANEATKLAATDLFEDKITYVSQSKTPVYNGDILVTQSKGHTVVVVSGNARSSSSSTSTTSTTSSTSTSSSSSSSKTTTSSSKPSYTVGKTYTTQVELNVRKGAGTNYAKVGYSGLTADGKKHDSDKDGAIDKGTTVTCKAKKTVGSDIWIKIPSGWIAAYYSGKVYVK